MVSIWFLFAVGELRVVKSSLAFAAISSKRIAGPSAPFSVAPVIMPAARIKDWRRIERLTLTAEYNSVAKQASRVAAILLWLVPVLLAQSYRDAAAVLQQGERLVQAGQLQAARELYEKAAAGFPENAGLAFDLGM